MVLEESQEKLVEATNPANHCIPSHIWLSHMLVPHRMHFGFDSCRTEITLWRQADSTFYGSMGDLWQGGRPQTAGRFFCFGQRICGHALSAINSQCRGVFDHSTLAADKLQGYLKMLPFGSWDLNDFRGLSNCKKGNSFFFFFQGPGVLEPKSKFADLRIGDRVILEFLINSTCEAQGRLGAKLQPLAVCQLMLKILQTLYRPECFFFFFF